MIAHSAAADDVAASLRASWFLVNSYRSPLRPTSKPCQVSPEFLRSLSIAAERAVVEPSRDGIANPHPVHFWHATGARLPRRSFVIVSNTPKEPIMVQKGRSS